MARPLFLITGFGAFEDVAENASQRLVEGLLAEPPRGAEIVGRVLPVSFQGSAAAVDLALAELGSRRPQCFFSMGVSRDPHFRFERRARPELATDRADNDGQLGANLALQGGPRQSSFPLEGLAQVLSAAGGGPTPISDDAGRYVCERLYYHILSLGEACGVPAIFLHVPRLELMPLARQLPAVRALLEHLARTLSSSGY